MDGILNEQTRTVHKHETGATDMHTPCGVTYNLDRDQLQKVRVEDVTVEEADRCGRCFEGLGGY